MKKEPALGVPARPLLRRLWLPAVVLLAGVTAATTLAQPAPEPGTTRPQAEFYQSFKDNQDSRPYRLIGPDADRCVRFEPEGLRITLPAGFEGPRQGTGVSLDFTVRGDFEITVAFAILREPDADGAGLGVAIDMDVSPGKRTTINRVVRKGGRMFTSWLAPVKQGPEKTGGVLTRSPTEAMSGRFRLSRTGADLSHAVAEGPGQEFTLLKQLHYGEEDLKYVRIIGTTAGVNAALDVRITELRIRADALPDVAAAAVTAPSWRTGGAGRGLLLVPLAALAIAALLGSLLYLRKRRSR